MVRQFFNCATFATIARMNESLENSESIARNFEEQFGDVRTVEIFGENVDFIDITPAEQKYENPLFMAPGWSETPTTFKDTIEVFFDAGHRVLSVDHGRLVPHAGDPYPLSADERAILAEYNVEKQGGVPIPELLKAKALLEILNHQSVKKTDVVAHSEGAIYTMVAAALSPERFGDIVLVGPASLVEEDSVLHRVAGGVRTYLQGFKKMIVEPESREALMRGDIESMKTIARNPAAALEEVAAIAHFNIEGMLSKLHEKGLKISIVHGQDEVMYPIKGMRGMVHSDDVYEYIEMPRGDHQSIYMKDEARFVEGVLKSMNERAAE